MQREEAGDVVRRFRCSRTEHLCASVVEIAGFFAGLIRRGKKKSWIPACAGMTVGTAVRRSRGWNGYSPGMT
jgi:hypothetical protein